MGGQNTRLVTISKPRGHCSPEHSPHLGGVDAAHPSQWSTNEALQYKNPLHMKVQVTCDKGTTKFLMQNLEMRTCSTSDLINRDVTSQWTERYQNYWYHKTKIVHSY